jgi:hypothetical protein
MNPRDFTGVHVNMKYILESALVVVLLMSVGLALLMVGAYVDAFSLTFPFWVRLGFVSTFFIAVLVAIAAGLCLRRPRAGKD